MQTVDEHLAAHASGAADVEARILNGTLDERVLDKLTTLAPSGFATTTRQLSANLPTEVEAAATRLEHLAKEQVVGDTARASALDLLAQARTAANVSIDDAPRAIATRADAVVGYSVDQARAPQDARQWLHATFHTTKYHPDRATLIDQLRTALVDDGAYGARLTTTDGLLAALDKRLGTTGTDDLLSRLDASDLHSTSRAIDEAFAS
jgi:hypothetical protein